MTPEELRGLFLFESLTDEQLGWLARHATVRDHPAGDVVLAEGDPATEFLLLRSGAITLSRRVRGDEVEVNRTDQRGAYMGATLSYIRRPGTELTYTATVRTVTASSFVVLPGAEFGDRIREWFPLAIHLLEGLFLGMRNAEVVIGQRERLAALGSLTAGLMHELNNPAAATVRATAALRERVAGMRLKLGKLADGRIEPARLLALTQLQDSVVERAAKAPKLTAMQASDREDELADWLDERDVAGGWDLAPVFATAGLDIDCLDDIERTVGHDLLGESLRWLGYALETEQLMDDIEDAGNRISSLVSAAKQYSQLDRASRQRIDVHDGLDSTLVMLAHKLGDGITVVKEYDRTLPLIPAHPAELNQVWTNLIDNAVHAMASTGEREERSEAEPRSRERRISAGRLTLRTGMDGDCVLVEVCDTGPGVPPELHRRVFEPFFTTKPVGQGTGLGLDISYRIVVNGHGGDISLSSKPGDTRFRVRLPLTETPPV